MMISMNKPLLILTISAIIIGAVLIPNFSEDLADAKSTKKIHFTETFTSSQDPGLGHETHQFAMILAPEQGIIYDGSMTYTSNKPVEIVVLHEIEPGDSKGQPIWTVDNTTLYGFSLIDLGTKSGSFEFTGSALALHATEEQFISTVSVDGWIRGGTIDLIPKKIEIEKEPPSVNLPMTSIPVKIPMHNGMYNGNQTLYIITDSNQEKFANTISEKQEWRVEIAPLLSTTPESLLGEIYLFKNGINGDGLYGFQEEVFSNTPDQYEEYHALRKVVNVSWKLGQNFDTLNSVEDIIQAEKNGRIETEETKIIVNTPQIVWPNGQMPIHENIDNEDEYGGGQILEIDKDSGFVTFVAHRGWGSDGRTIYYIIADATPTGPAEILGVPDTPISSELVSGSNFATLYQFKNGLIGSGPLGFQPIISSAVPGDDKYSPIWRISLVEWNDNERVKLLETIHDVNSAKDDGEITVSIARPANEYHILNCPLIDPFQNSKDKLSS